MDHRIFKNRLETANDDQGSDGAHSNVRKSLGYKMIGDSTDSVWGVMDIYPRTNFPDIRKKVRGAKFPFLITPLTYNRLQSIQIQEIY
jgi:2-polyprenyl-6-methoxyphenol hydroxylase-like FAD-dependent oxidoreductase